MEDRESARVVGREPCPSCGSRDNLSRYDDGSAYCFTPGCARYEPPSGDSRRPVRERKVSDKFLEVTYRDIPRRKLDAATCAKYGYGIATLPDGRTVQVANYRDKETGLELVAQKVRTSDKKFWIIGDIERAGLFGQHLWSGGGKQVVVTEGELDALSVAQAFHLNWPVVSIKSGAHNAHKDLKASLEFLEGYSRIVLWFDNDAAGRSAVSRCASLFTPGKVTVAETPH